MIISEIDKEKIEAIIRQAGTKLLEFWPGNNKDLTLLNVQKKEDGSSVTDADFASNQIIMEALRTHWADYGIISEEVPDEDSNRAKSRVWIIDPLDGTKAFIAGRDDFSVLIGLAVNKQAHYGAMYFPKRDLFASGELGQGSYLNRKRLAVSQHETLRPSSIYYRNFTPPKHDCFFEEWLDSGLAFLMLSRGEFDGMIIRMSSHKEWDIAAPAIITKESGGIVTDENGNEILFNVGGIASRYVVASNGKIHEKLLDFIPRD